IAYEPERAKTNFAHELAECAAYFMLVSKAPGLDKQTSQKLWDSGMSLRVYGVWGQVLVRVMVYGVSSLYGVRSLIMTKVNDLFIIDLNNQIIINKKGIW
ncbi:MAG: hypothetical protein L0922_03385, partial [Candidatus Mariimomonas ferrooxydans]